MATPKLLEAACKGTHLPDDDGSDENFVYGGPENAVGVGELQECIITKSNDLSDFEHGVLQMPIDHSEIRIVKTLDKAFVSTDAGPDTPVTLERCFVKSWSTSGDADDRPTESLAVDPNNPNGDLTPGPDDDVVDLPAVQTDDGLLLPAVQDDGLLLPAVPTGGVSVASGDVNGDTDALGDPVTFTLTVEPSLSLFNAFMTIETIPDSGVQSLAVDPTNPNMESDGRDDGWCMATEIDSPESAHALYDLIV
jgi:hypothetical protein